jgi:hypothetical protein
MKFYLQPNILNTLVIENRSYRKGVFASEYIDIDETILKFGGNTISYKALPYPYEPEKDYFLQLGEDQYPCPSGNMDHHVNHSCCPNSGVRILNTAFELVAISSIQC